MKDDIASTNMGVLKAIPAAIEKSIASGKQMNSMFGFFGNPCCCCCPVHISKTREHHEDNLKKT